MYRGLEVVTWQRTQSGFFKKLNLAFNHITDTHTHTHIHTHTHCKRKNLSLFENNITQEA